jgi:selenocysteine-specific elongation factor
VGSAEILARARVLGAKEIAPGETGWVQLALRQPAAVVRGDRFILRRPSPPATLGGGEVLDAHPGRQHRRFRPEVLARLQTLAVGTPGDLLLQKLQRLEPIALAKFQREAGLEPAQFAEALAEVLGDGRARQLDQVLLSESRFQTIIGQMGQTVGQYHAHNPLRLGMPREELRSRLKLTAALFNALLPHSGLVEEGALVRTAGHTIRFTAAQQTRLEALLADFARAGVNSPSVKEAQAAVGEEVYYALVDLGELVPLNEGVVYAWEEYGRVVAQISAFMRQNGPTSAAEVRDLLDTSRKYVIALLEHLDQRQITRRTGEVRELVEIKKPSPP